MRETIAFLRELAANNNKQWFDANRARYRVLRTRFEEFTAELIDGIGTFDAEVRGLTPADPHRLAEGAGHRAPQELLPHQS